MVQPVASSSSRGNANAHARTGRYRHLIQRSLPAIAGRTLQPQALSALLLSCSADWLPGASHRSCAFYSSDTVGLLCRALQKRRLTPRRTWNGPLFDYAHAHAHHAREKPRLDRTLPFSTAVSISRARTRCSPSCMVALGVPSGAILSEQRLCADIRTTGRYLNSEPPFVRCDLFHGARHLRRHAGSSTTGSCRTATLPSGDGATSCL